ncbi:MAG: tryptophan synthase subunit alpha [Planctomycetota bacterium]|jgi:tryptophan synthase alpha chain
MSLDDNRIVRTFAQARAAGRKQLLPFLTAGYPDLAATEAMLGDLESRGAEVCEIGFPFSDPIADGPTIQASYTDVLNKGLTCDEIFEMVKRYRAAGGNMALVAMVSYSIVFRQGAEAFAADAKAAGFDGLIVPDLPVDEAAGMEDITASAGLCNVLLIAPTTPPERRVDIARQSQGFIYYISVAGITGERDKLPPETIQAVAELRTHTDTPICVGFGISNAETVRTVCQAADGAIVGSAIIHRITDAKDGPTEQLVEKVGSFVGELLAPLA